MRRAFWAVSLSVVFAGCWGEVSQPELRRPLESLPEGACILLVASGLANTWERAEAHGALQILQRIVPQTILAQPGIADLRARLVAFEERTGTRVRDDILLNALGGRVAMGAYADEAGRSADVLFVAELQDADRFARALDAVRSEPDSGVQFEATKLGSRDALRVTDDRGLEILLVQEGNLLVLATATDLATEALAIHTGTSENSALRDPAVVAAIDELGLHNVVLVEPVVGSEALWRAQGFSWDATGVHLKRVVQVSADTAVEPPLVQDIHRDEIMQSIPSGMTLAYYSRPTDLAVVRELFQGGEECFDWRSSRDLRMRRGDGAHGLDVVRASAAASAAPLNVLPAAPPLGLNQLPFDMAADLLPWVGDEMAFVLAELVATPIAPVPSAALIVEVADPELADRMLSSFDDVVLKFGAIDFRGFEAVRYGGQTYKTFAQPILDVVSPCYLVDGEVCIFTTTRALMQLIIDTRRVGKRHLLSDASFEPFLEFVPSDASAVLYADQHRLQRSLQQLTELTWLGGEMLTQAIEIFEGLSVLFDHFPSGAVYLERNDDTITMNGWMLEKQ